MKKYELNLSKYDVTATMPITKEDGSRAIEKQTKEYPLRENLSSWLRAPGVFKAGEEIVEAVMLGKMLLKVEGDSVILDEREAKILKDGINRHIAIATENRPGIMPLGGPIHEEAVCRVFGMKEVDNG